MVVTYTTPQAHTAGRREGVTHLPVNACPRCTHFSDALKKSQTYKKETETLNYLRPDKQVSPSSQSAKCEGGGGDDRRLRGCLCGVCVHGKECVHVNVYIQRSRRTPRTSSFISAS